MAEQGAYGGFWVRFLAYLVDSIIFFTLLVALAAGAAFLGDLGATVITAAALLGPILYWGLMQASARQATFGKALLGMKVTDVDGQRLSLRRSLGRELAKIVSSVPLMLGFVLAAFTARKQALHDMIASTTVQREASGHVLVALLIGLFGWIAPIALVFVVGAGLLAGMMGAVGGGMMLEAMKDGQKAQVAQRAPVPKKAAPAAVAVSAQPATPAAAPTPKAPIASAPSAPAPSAPAQTAALPVEPAKPAPAVKVAETPAPVMVAADAKPAREARVDLPGPIQARTIDLPGALEPLPPRAGPKYNDVMSAVMTSDTATLQELLAFGKWPDKPDSRGMTPLTAAALRGDRASAELLLKAGADGGRALNVARERRDDAMISLLERYRATSKRP